MSESDSWGRPRVRDERTIRLAEYGADCEPHERADLEIRAVAGGGIEATVKRPDREWVVRAWPGRGATVIDGPEAPGWLRRALVELDVARPGELG